MQISRAAIFLGLLSFGLFSIEASAQRRRARGFSADDALVEWSVFVLIPGQSGRRSVIPAANETGSVEMAGSDWACSYQAPARIRIDAINWSETRQLECRLRDAVVSVSGSCQVGGSQFANHAQVLSLGTNLGSGAAERTRVTLDCTVRLPQ